MYKDIWYTKYILDEVDTIDDIIFVFEDWLKDFREYKKVGIEALKVDPSTGEIVFGTEDEKVAKEYGFHEELLS